MADVSNHVTDDLIRELYARFGLAYYYSEVLHRGLCIMLALSDLPRKDLLTRPRVEERLSYAFSLTLGEVVSELTGKLPDDYSTRLVKALETRNFLAHHFWFDRIHLMLRVEHVQQLVEELDAYTELFNRLNKEIIRRFRGRWEELGLTAEVLQDSLDQIISGQKEEPLPDKELVREREKKLKGRQLLVRVWEFRMAGGRKPLLFEMADGSFWQLCDMGLGWTQYHKVEPHWTEVPAVKPHLPAEILPRPRDAKPWEYQFKLKHDALLWVKPGKHPKTFLWGISTKGQRANQKNRA